MTRLTDAFERARASTGADTPASSSPVDAESLVPNTWRFEEVDGGIESPIMPANLEPPITQEDLEQVTYSFTNNPAIAAKLVVGPSPNPVVVEQFRHLAASLHHAQLRSGSKTVMIASAVESEGKTTTAANLALTFSHSHRRRVLLVDADLRRPSIHTLFNLSNKEGLTDALKVITPDTPLPLQHVSPTLSVLTAGHPTSDPMSALVSDMMKEFMREAAQQYDWVVLDTPPVALLSDANLLAAMIDLAVIVVNAQATPYPMVRRAVEAIGPAKVLGTVLNRARRPGLGGRYHYGYRYNYAYRPSDPQKDQPKRWVLPFRRNR